MQIFPTNDEIELAADLLVNQYKVSAQLLGRLFNKEQRDQANSIITSLGGHRLRSIDTARLLIQRDGPNLFAGSKDVTRDLRLNLLQQLPDPIIQDLFARNQNGNVNISSVSHMPKPLSEKKWHPGKRWAKDFVIALGFPEIFAGIVPDEKVITVEDIDPMERPPQLAEFQEGLKIKMLEVLKRDGEKTRCVVTLPTGGGKTRVAVEAFIDWMQPRFSERKYLVWIAQNEELCEQAIACIRSIWGFREFVERLRIYRFFGGRDISEDQLIGGVVVASIQQLYKRVKSGDQALEKIIKGAGAMIIDEAHRATSEMYDVLLDKADEICGPNHFPICGLTATPGRSGLNRDEETTKMVGRFDAYLIKPDLGPEYEENPLAYFRKYEYLAKAYHVLYQSDLEYTLTPEEVEKLELEKDLPAEFLKRLANDKKRNCKIIQRLLKIPSHTPTLVYACTVEHAYFLASILTASGRKARALSADTPVTLRRALIREFKNGEIDFLCNFGVLTTGFDAPKTECIALCRPTTSEVLYEQIIGRGLRGPRFGGTPECTIIDFADNIRRFGPQLAYARFAKEFWNQESKEKD